MPAPPPPSDDSPLPKDPSRFSDIAARMRAKTAGALSTPAEYDDPGQRQQMMLAMLAQAEDLAEFGCFDWYIQRDEVWWSESLYGIFGLPNTLASATGAMMDRVDPRDAPRLEAAIDESFRTGLYACRYRYRRGDHEVRHIDARGRVFFDERGQPERMVGVIRDETPQVERERWYRQLAREARHRLGNNLALVKSLIAFLRGQKGLDGHAQGRHLEEQVDAMIRAHRFITESEDGRVDLREAMLSLNPLPRPDEDDRLKVHGPGVELVDPHAYAICLVVHELMTNARKYGGLSRPDGRVHVRWTLQQPDHDRRLIVEWRETGTAGPASTPPSSTPPHAGVGLHLVHGIIEYQLNGRFQHRLDHEGFHAELDIPLGKPTPEPTPEPG